MFWNTDQRLDQIIDELDKLRIQNRRNTHHILRVMYRQHQQTLAKLDELLAGASPALKAELQFGTPIDKPVGREPRSETTAADEIYRRASQAASKSTPKPAVGGPPQRS